MKKLLFGVVAASAMVFASVPSAYAEISPPLHNKLKKNGCYECHRNEEKFIGPSFQEIGQRYRESANPALIDLLTKKIINGGLGAWGNTPMNSNPQVPNGEARTIVKLILQPKK